MGDYMIDTIEKAVDNWLPNLIPKSIPRYKYIYHCNLAHIDLLISQGALFTPMERHYQFALTYNTHLAHRLLAEEDSFNYQFDLTVYRCAYKAIIYGMQYSMLCDLFPLLHSNKATLNLIGNHVTVSMKNISKKNYKFISDYTLGKLLSYNLQMLTGRMQKEGLSDEDIALNLAKFYSNYWNENMLYEDYEPYSQLEWGGFDYFFIVASMRRFINLYKFDFNIEKLDSQKMMILLSPKGVFDIRGFVPSDDVAVYNQVFEENVFKPIGKGLYPKLSITDAPINKTKDGYVFANPLTILFQKSSETRFLGYLRKCDNDRFLRIKDKIKERAIPLIMELIKLKFPNVICIQNFHVAIPNSKNNTRECDLLLVDDKGVALYLEIKHFYDPQSFNEIKRVDAELEKALHKMPAQLLAIRNGWEKLKHQYGFEADLHKLNGVIVSHRYLGYDIEIEENTPIISAANLYEDIASANEFSQLFDLCREIDTVYSKAKFVNRPLSFQYGNYSFEVDVECFDPAFEILLRASFLKQVDKNLNDERPVKYHSVSELAAAYLDTLSD